MSLSDLKKAHPFSDQAVADKYDIIINPDTKRTILRSMHIFFGLPLLGFIYGPPAETLQYLPFFRFVYMPVVVLSGLLMWKGHVLGRLFSKKSV